jgi:hypothetical protein
MTLQFAPPRPVVQARDRRGARLARSWPATTVVSLLASILAWRPYAWHAVYAGLDPSWEVGLAMGFMRHLQWGPSLIFSFGPYGFLDAVLPFYGLTALLAVLYAIAVTWGLGALIVDALRPTWGLIGAGAVAWAVLAIAASKMGYSDLATGTALALALAALKAGLETAGREMPHSREMPRSRERPQSRLRGQSNEGLVLLGLLGALSGLQLLVKTNDGLVALGLLAVVVVLGGFEWRRAALAALVPLVGVSLAAWVAAGQSVRNVVSYVRGSISVAVGYSSAMQLSHGRQTEDVLAIFVGALLALLFVLSTRQTPWRYRLAVFLLLAGFGWAAVKEGFVRHDAHDFMYFALMMVAMSLARLERRHVPLQAAALVVAAVATCLAAGGVPVQLHAPGATATAFYDDVKAVLGLGGMVRAQATARTEFLSTGDALPGSTLSLLEGHSVAIEPVEDSIAFDYPGLDWDPEPVLQGYSAYTSYLDGLNASFLASSRAPQRILFQPGDVVNHVDEFLDPPATLESMYCHYLQLPAPGPWQVLGRVTDRCGTARRVEQMTAHFGQVVAVPREPGEMVVATFSFGAPLRTRTEGVLLKPPPAELTAWDSGGGAARGTTYRFIAGTAPDYHVVSVPPSLGYSAPFTPPDIARLDISGGGWQTGEGEIGVTFYAVDLRRH